MIRRTVTAGTAEKQDVLVTVGPGECTQILIERAPHPRFHDALCQTVRETLKELSIHDVRVEISDYGALEFVIQARLRAAIKLAKEGV